MGIGKKMSKGSIGGGVNISHKSKMSQSAKNQMSFPGGMPGPGDYGKVVGKGMAKYLSGESVGMKKYGKHKGPAQAKPDYIDIDGDGNKTESMKQAADGMGKYGHKSKGPAKKSYKQAYKDRDQKTYGEMSEEEYIKEAKRQNASKKSGKGYDAPKKPIKKAKVEKVEKKAPKVEKATKELKTNKENASKAQEARQDTRKSKRISKRANRVNKREDIRKGRAKAKADGLKGKAKRDAIKASKVAAKEKQAKANK